VAAIQSLNVTDFIDSLISLFSAFVLGTLIGAERQYRQRQGGLRTNARVALGAAAFVDIGMHLNGNPGATQIIAYVVSGVGFIGAGVIMKQGGNVWGLNTAATFVGTQYSCYFMVFRCSRRLRGRGLGRRSDRAHCFRARGQYLVASAR
jgi:hypothetical protein